MNDAGPPLRRRDALSLVAGVGAMLLPSFPSEAAGRDGRGENADWPVWAPTRAALYARFAAQARTQGRDLRSFGAVMDGRHDDSAAVERALASDAGILRLPALPVRAALRLTRQIRIDRPVSIIGEGARSLIRYEGHLPDAFLAMAEGNDPTRFLTNIHIDNIAIARPAPLASLGVLLRGYNLRDVSVTRCTTHRMGALIVQHMREKLRLLPRGAASGSGDPAVTAGFSVSGTDDLSERILVFDNRVDAGSYMSRVVRFDYARQVAVVGNVGRFANVSWWGGAARVGQGGDIRFPRRARDIYVADNQLSGANGGIYGNNGDGIVVVRNIVRDMIDVGIDFEGCFNALAAHNVVTNAGNFCFATFYAARNILFRDNIGVQDGSAAGLAAAYGTRPYGRSTGRALFALRSAGFGSGDGAVDVAFVNNQFRWTGKAGHGICIPSYADRLRVEGNIFENVRCDLAYARTRTLILRNNRLAFDRPGDPPVRLLGGAALRTTIVGNEIRSTAAQPAGSAAILVRQTVPLQALDISGNRILSPSGPLPIVIQSTTPAVVTLSGNQADAVHAALPATIRGDRNVSAAGRPIRPSPLPPAYRPAPTPDTVPVPSDD